MSRRPKDPEAFERKIRPIYDALDSRNWKGALKLCQQALQKYPDNELVKVLRAIGLERSGKREEANQVVDEVAARTPTDEQVLRLAAMVMRASSRFSDITRMYEAAAAAAATHPGAGDLALVLLHEVFGAHVRESNFVKQQQVALRLSKAVGGSSGHGGGTDRYSWWVVMSLLLQARAALRARTSGIPAPSGQVPAVALDPEKLLALAEGMISRQANKDGRLEGYEPLMVYVDVLIAQGKVSEALTLVSGPMGAASIRLPSERLQLRAVLTALSGDLAGAAELLREGLALNPDDWGALLLLMDCMLPATAVTTRKKTSPTGDQQLEFTPRHPLVLISGGVAEQLPPRGVVLTSEGGATSDAFNGVKAVLQEVVSMSKSASTGCNDAAVGSKHMIMRGPDLALVDVAMRQHQTATSSMGSSDLPQDTEGAVVDAILSYFLKYGHLVSCAVDLRAFVSQLSDSASIRLEAAVQQALDDAEGSGTAASSGNSGAALAQIRRRVCAAQLRDDLGLPRLASCEEGVVLAGEMLELYGMAQPLQEGLDERERGAADELPVLAASALASSAAMAPSDAAAVPYMLAAYGALAEAVQQRPFGAGMRISMSALAALLGAPVAAANHLYKLDIKHIQLDTLGAHLLLPALLAWPAGGSVGMDGAQQQQQQAHQLLQRALRDTRALFEDHGRDAGETLFTAYNHGMYTKVLEFTAFRERLAAAHTMAAVRAEGAVLDCLQSINCGTSNSNAEVGHGGSPAEGAAGDGLRTAAAAAAATLKAKELPNEGCLRFNWDLSARPTWLPPCSASPSLNVVEWWRDRSQGKTRGQGYGRCWWTSTSSAEGPSQAASEWRAAQTTAAAHRWLLPHCIAGALGATGAEVIPLQDAVELLRGLRPTDSRCDRPGAGTLSSSATCASLPGSDELSRLDVLLYEAALAVQSALPPLGLASSQQGSSGVTDTLNLGAESSASPISIGEDVGAAGKALGALMSGLNTMMAATTEALASSIAESTAWGGVLPGGALGVLSHLLREPVHVLATCLLTWQGAIKSLRKRKAKASATAEDSLQSLGAALTTVTRELVATLQACSKALAVWKPAETSVVATVVLTLIKGQNHAALCTSEASAAAIKSLVEEQRSTVAALSRQAVALITMLS